MTCFGPMNFEVKKNPECFSDEDPALYAIQQKRGHDFVELVLIDHRC